MSLYSRSMSCADVRGELMDMAGISVSAAAGITAGRVIDDVRQRRQMPLESCCPVVRPSAGLLPLSGTRLQCPLHRRHR